LAFGWRLIGVWFALQRGVPPCTQANQSAGVIAGWIPAPQMDWFIVTMPETQ
jgi:hypothetical protein